ncbi:MAG: hypothetical protein IK053_01720, partial [Muribaculaceae bacterium]|nr:hypothetical protein [Muribaculaceae bacterium]
SGSGYRPGGNSGSNNGKPSGNNSGSGSSVNRPGGNSGSNNGKPGGNNNGSGSSVSRPGGSGPSNNNSGSGYRPNNGNSNGHGYGNGSPRPTNGSHAYSGGYHPSYKGPGSVNHPSHYSAPARPMRPKRPDNFFYSRPVRPSTYRPVSALYFNSFLGISIGMSLNSSLDYLLANNYYIDGYSNNIIYLRYVTELNYRWPDATLFFNGGRLEAAEFIYSTAYNDTSRYNNIFSELLRRYGNPISVNSNNGYSATWFGSTGFITLDYHPAYANNSYLRYYTTLSYGM